MQSYAPGIWNALSAEVCTAGSAHLASRVTEPERESYPAPLWPFLLSFIFNKANRQIVCLRNGDPDQGGPSSTPEHPVLFTAQGTVGSHGEPLCMCEILEGEERVYSICICLKFAFKYWMGQCCCKYSISVLYWVFVCTVRYVLLCCVLKVLQNTTLLTLTPASSCLLLISILNEIFYIFTQQTLEGNHYVWLLWWQSDMAATGSGHHTRSLIKKKYKNWPDMISTIWMNTQCW